MSLALLNRQPVTWDSEAASYLTAVESADTQSLEPAVARAINTFVIDCKIRGIWGAIKSSCLLCGARTLNGALVPLKGAAPTSFNFVSNDYNRETGLKGNGSNKYLDSNRAGTSDPSDNSHCSVYVSSPGVSTTTSYAYIGQNGFTTGASSIGTDGGSNNYLFLSLKAGNGTISGFSTVVGLTGALGLIGLSRNNNNNFNYRFNSRTGTANVVATTVGSGNWEIFGRGGASRLPTNGRLSFYSIGEALDLRLLDQCVMNLRRNIIQSIGNSYSITDSDVLSYISSVEAIDGLPLESAVKQAINTFILGLKSDNLWSSIKASCILCGAKTFDGALTPLVGNTPYTVNFDKNTSYSRSLGIIGTWDGYTALYTGRLNSLYSQDNNHCAVYQSVSGSNLNYFFGTTNTSSSAGGLGLTARGQAGSLLMSTCRNSTTGTIDSSGSLNGGPGLLGVARNSSSSYTVRGKNISETITSTSTTPLNEQITIFAKGAGGVNSSTGARLSFYSIGDYLDLSLLDSRVATLMTALSNASI